MMVALVLLALLALIVLMFYPARRSAERHMIAPPVRKPKRLRR